MIVNVEELKNFNDKFQVEYAILLIENNSIKFQKSY